MADEIAHKPTVSETEEARPPAPSAPSEKVNRPTGFAAPGMRTVGDPAEDPNGCVSPTARTNAIEPQEETDADGNIPPQSEMADEIDVDAHAERVGKTRRELEKELKKQPRLAAPPQAKNEAVNAGTASEVGDSGLSDTARALAKRDFDEPRWLAEHALLWIAFRNSDALALSFEELQRQRFGEALGYGASDSLACKNPVYELLKALKLGRLKAIDAAGNELPPRFWDEQSSDPRTWRKVRFARADVLREWPDPEKLAATATQKFGHDPDSIALLASYIGTHYAGAKHNGVRTNRNKARKSAEHYFRKSILEKTFREAMRLAKVENTGGRPRTREK